MHHQTFTRVVSAIRATAQHSLPESIRREHSLVFDLGFDSIGIAMLSVGLEDEFSFPILLDSWIGSHDGPQSLTVDSLCSYMGSLTDAGSAVAPA